MITRRRRDGQADKPRTLPVGVNYVAFEVDDIERPLDFYRRLFGSSSASVTLWAPSSRSATNS
jgi:hypothetical protein